MEFKIFDSNTDAEIVAAQAAAAKGKKKWFFKFLLLKSILNLNIY